MFTVGSTPGVSDYNIVVKGTGNANTDESNLAAAVSTLNGWGKGTLWIDGQVILLNNKNFTAPIHLKGLNSDAEILVQNTNPSFVAAFSWNQAFIHTHLISYSVSSSKDLAEYISVSGTGYTPTEGDWVLLWSSNDITGVEPHTAGGTQSPMELHQVQEYDSAAQRAYFADPITDILSVSGNLGVMNMDENVEVENLTFNQNTTQYDFQNSLYFRNINGVKVRNIHMRRGGVGAIFATFCTNVDISEIQYDGTYANDNVYGVVAGVVNGFTFRDSTVYGTRHAFTTTAGSSTGIKRYGTPLKCVIDNVRVYVPSKISSSNVKTTRIGLDTHAEGYGVTFQNCHVFVQGDTSNIGISFRSRNVRIKNCQVHGSYSNDTGNGAIGVVIGGSNAIVENCIFSNLWFAVRPNYVYTVGSVKNAFINNCTFNKCTSYAILMTDGSGHTINNCIFKECGSLLNRSCIEFTTNVGNGHRITNCTFIKDNCNVAINQLNKTPSDIKVLGNNFIGFSYPTSSGPLGFLNSGVYGSNMELAYAYSNHYDNTSYAGRKSGQDALGNISGVYTMNFTSGTYDNKTAVLAGNLTLTASGRFAGEHYLLVSQDAVGGRTITWSNINWNGTDPQPKSSGLTTSLFELYHTGDGTWYGMSYVND